MHRRTSNVPSHHSLSNVQVTYPSDLLGISGAISEITKEYVAKLDADPNRAVIAADYLDTCLPRMVVDSQCVGSLPQGDFFNMTVRGNIVTLTIAYVESQWIPVNGSIPQCMCPFLSFRLDLDKGAVQQSLRSTIVTVRRTRATESHVMLPSMVMASR